jgi:hypothetical protein
MGCDHSTIARHLQSMGKVQMLGVWVPHILTQDNKNQLAAICAPLLACHRLARQQHQIFCPALPLATKNGASTSIPSKGKNG